MTQLRNGQRCVVGAVTLAGGSPVRRGLCCRSAVLLVMRQVRSLSSAGCGRALALCLGIPLSIPNDELTI